MAVELNIEGFEALDLKLRALPNALQNKIIKKALRNAGKQVLAKAKAAAPRDRPVLVKTLKLRAIKRNRGGLTGVRVITGTRAELGIPPDAKGYYPMALEKGTSKMAARPFMAPAIETQRQALTQQIGQEIGAAIEAEAKKL